MGKEYTLIPLFYAESGSRLWGFASKDSDYDVRGIHLPNRKQYFSISRPQEQFEVRVKRLDVVSFSLDKAFNLLAKSNPSLLEWLMSDIIYYNEFPDFQTLRKSIIQNINLRSLFNHYLSLAKRNFEKYMLKDKEFSYKRVLYILRGLLSATYIHEFNQLPLLKFDELCRKLELSDDIRETLSDILQKKLTSTEREKVRDRAKVLQLMRSLFDRMSGLRMKDTGDRNSLKRILNDYSIKTKKEHYCKKIQKD